MRYRVSHTTTYSTTQRVSVCHNIAHLAPRETKYQTTVDHDLSIAPEATSRTSHVDSFGNVVTNFSFSEGYDTLSVESVNDVIVRPPESVTEHDDLAWEKVRDGDWSMAVQDPRGMGDVRQFLFDSPRIRRQPRLAEYAAVSFTPGRPLFEALYDLTHRIFTEFTYSSKATSVTTPIDKVFDQKAGVCQDFAHLKIAMLRSLGLPAAYVSGYLRTYPKKGAEHLIGSSASHAWVSVYGGRGQLGDAGWVDIDPTNNKFLTDEFVTIARGRDYGDVAPLRGVFIGSGQHSLKVAVDVRPLEED